MNGGIEGHKWRRAVFACRAGGWVLAALTFLLFAATVLTSPNYIEDVHFMWQSDSKSYVSSALYMQGHVALDDLRHRSPVYPLFLVLCGGTNGRDGVLAARCAQVGFYVTAGALLMAALAWVTRSPLVTAGVGLVLLMHRDGWCFANAVMSETMALSIFLLFAAGVLLAMRLHVLVHVAWFGVGVLLATLGCTRPEFAVAALPPCLFLLGVALHRRGRHWRGRVVFLAVGLCVPVLLAKSFLAVRGKPETAAVTRSGRRWQMMAKMGPPHFYVGPDNTADENAIALLWNNAYRNGRTGSQAARCEYFYVRQCYPRYQRFPLGRFGPDVWAEAPGPPAYDLDAFDRAVAQLFRRSVLASPWPIAGKRFFALYEWCHTEQNTAPPWRVGCTTRNDLLRDLKAFDYRDLPVDLAVMAHHWLPGYYRLEFNVILCGVLLVVYAGLTSRRGWPFVVMVGLVPCGIFLMVGLFYQGFHGRYKITLHPGFWILNIFMLHAIISDVSQRLKKPAEGTA